MSAVELATAYVTIAASGNDLPSSLGKAFVEVERRATDSGRRMGKALTGEIGKATKADVDAAKAAYDQAAKQVSATVERQATKVADAKRKEEIAQAKVNELLQSSKTAHEQAAKRVAATAAEQASKVEAALRQEELARVRVNEALAKNPAESSRVIAAQDRLASASQKVKAAQLEQEAAMERANQELKETASESSQVLAAQDRLAMASQKVKAAQLEQESATEKANRKLEETQRALNDAKQSAERAERPFQSLGDRVRAAFSGDFRGAFKPVEREADRSADTIEDRFDRAGRESGDGFTGAFKKGLGSLAAVATAYIGLDTAKDGFMAAIGGAAELEQSIGGVNTVFKDNAAQMLQWSDTADQTLGMSANEYNEYASRLGASLKNAGMPMDQLAGKTNDLITMGADLASLYGGTTTEAVDALSAALRGEMDPIERYGISLNEAALNAEGAAMGLTKLGGSWSNQQKQLIVMSLLQKQSADATGNFARESDTASNVLQRLQAYLKDTAAGLGSKLIPALAAAGGWLLDKGIPALEGFGTSMGNVFELLKTGDFQGGIFGLEEDSPIIGALFSIRDAGLEIWNQFLVPLGEWAGSNSGAITGAFEGVANAIGMVVGWIADHWQDVAAFLAGFGGTFLIAGLYALGSAIAGVVAAIAWVPLAIGAAVGALTWFFTQTELGRGILSAVVDWLVNSAWPLLQQVGAWIAAAAVWLWQSVLVPAWLGIQAAISATVDWLVNTAWPVIQAVWNALAAAAIWLWQSVILPVWDGIKTAIAVAVTAVLVYVDLLVWYWQNVLAPVAMWLWQSVIVPVWNGILGAIGAVVAWWEGTAWPIISRVIAWVSEAFTRLQVSLAYAWAWIQWHVINPVVVWWEGTAWPTISRVIDAAKAGFDRLRDGISAAWDFIKTKAIEPVANWLEDTVQPLFDRVTGGIGDAFDTLKTTVETVWNGIRDTAKEPIRFLVEDIILNGIVKKYNTVAGKFGVGQIDEKLFTVGWARGGILPGFTPMRSGDDVLTPMRSGEGVLVSEGLRDSRSRSLFLGANEAAKRGTSFADYLLGSGLGYATGGITEVKQIAQDMGLRLTSSYRPGARTARTGSPSLHSTGEAWDFAGPAEKMMAFFNAIYSRFKPTELLYSPAGSRNIHRDGKQYPNSGKTLSMHFNHVHVGMRGGKSEAGDGGGFSLNPFEGLWESLKDKVRDGVGTSPFGDMLFNLPKKLIDGGVEWAKNLVGDAWEMTEEQGQTLMSKAYWTPVATQALVREGQMGPFRLSALLNRMKKESNFNPKAINNRDSNAKKGTPSKGLMQVIQPTFNRYRDKSLSPDIYDPLANIVASIRYTLDRYGDLEKGWNRKGGYALGGIVDGAVYDTGGVLPSGQVAMNLSGRPEVVLNPAESRAYLAGQQSAGAAGDRPAPQVIVYAREHEDPWVLAQRLSEAVELTPLAVQLANR